MSLTDDEMERLNTELQKNKLRSPSDATPDVEFEETRVPDLSDPLDLPKVDSIDESLCEYIRELNDTLHSMHAAAIYNVNLRDEAGAGGIIIARALGMDPSGVQYHLSGQCVHRYNAEISEEQCETIRLITEDDMPYSEVADIMSNCSEYQARYHATGKCSHDVDAEPIPLRS